MGIYLNPGKNDFEEAAIRTEIFVDKTDMIGYLNTVVRTGNKYVSVSRPRRFGKTMAADMITAYYEQEDDARGLFSQLKLADKYSDWDRYLGKFDVIRLDMTEFIKDDIPVADGLKKLSLRVLSDLDEAYPQSGWDPDDLVYSFRKFYRKSGVQFVIVIDEWDCVFREKKGDTEGQRLYLDFLRDWLKDQSYVSLAYMTGILPIKKYGEHSALNMFKEYSMTSPKQMAEYTGFTEDEVHVLCDSYNMSYDDISAWYDGYVLNGIIPIEKRELYRRGRYDGNRYSIYSPLSVVTAVTTGLIGNYWNSTESYEALAEYIRKDFDGLKDTVALLMDGGRVMVNLSTYQNDMTTFRSKDDVLALLIHLGYLGFIPAEPDTGKGSDYGEVFIPNKEVLEVFNASTDTDAWAPTFRSFEKSQELVKATWNCNEEKVAELLEWFHDQASNKTYNDESALSYSIQLAYYAAHKYYTDILELDTGKGYADIVYLPAPKYADKPAMLIELKYDKNTETAMDQIKQRNYPQRLEHYKGNMLLISINYDSGARNTSDDFKHHSCRIEKA